MNMSTKLSNDEIDQYTSDFWNKLEQEWSMIHKTLIHGSDKDRENILNMLNIFASKLREYLDFEITVGEINRIFFKNNEIIELYISPRLLKDNIKYMNALYNKRKPLNNLQVFKYRSYK